MTRYNLIPAAFLLCGTVLSFWLGSLVDRSRMEELALETRITAEQVRLRLESCINTRVSVVNQLADPKWADATELRRNWDAEAASLVNLFTGIQALNWVDNAGIINVIHPTLSNERALNANLYEHPDPAVAQALRSAGQSGELARTNVIELLQGGGGFAIYQRVMSTTGSPLGFVNGVFRTQDLVETCLSEQELRRQFEFRLGELSGALVYQSTGQLDTGEGPLSVSEFIDVASRPWRLDLAPTPAFLISASSGIEDVWVYIGMLLVLLLAAAIRSLLLQHESLRDSQEKYRLLIENQSDMVVKFNRDNEFLYVSPSYCTTFGKTEVELLHHSFLPLVHAEDMKLTQDSLANLSVENPHSYHEQRALTKMGWRWLAWSNTGIFDEHNTLEAVAAVGRDITDVKKLKEDIAHNQKMQAIGEMASGITHDFNNLLQVMMANIEFLIRGSADNAKAREQLEKIQHALERARTLIAKLSTLSKQDMLIKSVVELNQFTADAIDMFRQSLPEQTCISFQHYPHKLHADIDAAQLERVMLNLLINAREAMDERGKIEVSISNRKLDAAFCSAHKPTVQPGDYVCITITDSGHGIPADALSRIFDPFYSTKALSKGGGLGLSNSYSIVKQLDGLIDVASTPGMGTMFTVYLPLVKAVAVASATANITAPESSGATKDLILVADDEPELLDLTTQMLQDHGYRTLAAPNGKKALQLYAKHRESIALVILDLVMPVMSGQQAAFEIRKTAPAAKILFISGYIPESEGRTIRLDGPLLRKPFRSATLLDQINSVL